ncbi:MAG: DNA polymerase III subunit alpha, partial [bacterium]
TDFGTEEEYRQRITHKQLFDEFTQNEKGEVVVSQEEGEEKIKKLGGYDRLYRIKLEADYLRKLALEGAEKRYPIPLSKEIMERINFELYIMSTMGFPGYFLIVQDFIAQARSMGISVGPGRGSAAGSVVAYCLKITDIDPIKYDLLFERFLNPDRISLPDIDIDFDDDGRGDILNWVTEKYGKMRVAQIVTYGTMATKSSIKDVGRVQKVPLPQVNNITALIPDKFSDDKADKKTGKLPKVNIKNCIKYVSDIADVRNGKDANLADMLRYAEMLEGTVRQVGIHACGLIIGADDLMNFAPISTAKDKQGKDVLVTQYEGSVIEDVGLIKMDFLGLKTLTVIKEALKNIKLSKSIDIDIDNIPIDDEKTYTLYSEGRTVGTFQFESLGMQKYLRELKPSVFEDLIAMNALYRPGPMDYIPQFIARKHGKEPIVYDLDCMDQYLKETYGITVYQEQVMLLSRLLANFTRGESDELRKAMGKKLRDKLDKMKPKFISQGQSNGHDPKKLEKIWLDWEKFASYAFNKSHATCYSWIAYQTAYLKANYPSEFMAATLTRNRDDIKEVTKFMDECKAMKLNVKGPDINESNLNFTVNTKGEIRFGLGGIKGVGEGAVEAVVSERNENGEYTSIYNFFERVNLSSCNKKTIEALAYAGAFDSFKEIERDHFFDKGLDKNSPIIETLLKYGNRFQLDKNTTSYSLFEGTNEIELPKPPIPAMIACSTLEKLNKEQELIGIYLSSHPLDEYRIGIKYGCNTKTRDLIDLNKLGAKSFVMAGIIVDEFKGTTRTNNPFGKFKLEDYDGTYEFALFGDDYIKFNNFFQKDLFVIVRGKIQARDADWKFKKPGQENKELVTKITAIELLNSESVKTLCKKITITLQINKIDQVFNTNFTSLISLNKGDSELIINIKDPEIRCNIKLAAKKYSVDINSKLIDELEVMQKNEILTFKIE